MDYFSHGLWSYIFFHRIKKPIYAVLFGLMPDTFSWVIYAIYNILTGSFFGKPNLDLIPDWAFTLYGISHSLIIWSVIILALFIVLRKVPLYVFAAPISIIMDVPTHSREFLPTPFLWPVSNWHFPGFSWGQGWFLLINYAFIFSLLGYIIYKKRKK